jgi:hypothetical protein
LKLIDEFLPAVSIQDDVKRYPLHLACIFQQSKNVVFKLFHELQQALLAKDFSGCNPLGYALRCLNSELVVLKLINECPQAAKEVHVSVMNAGALHVACRYKLSVKVVFKLINILPEAAKEVDDSGSYPLHHACRYRSHNSERVILAMIYANLLAVKHKDHRGCTPLHIAKHYRQSLTVLNVLEELMTKSYYDLVNCIGIPKSVTNHNLDSLRRIDTFQWTLGNSPIVIDGHYIQHQSTVTKVIEQEVDDDFGSTTAGETVYETTTYDEDDEDNDLVSMTSEEEYKYDDEF